MGTNRSDNRAVKVMRVLARVPGLEEYMTQNIYSIWRVARGTGTHTAGRSAAVA
jgi:hypothetical protein